VTLAHDQQVDCQHPHAACQQQQQQQAHLASGSRSLLRDCT
jgi:hypothetical protein